MHLESLSWSSRTSRWTCHPFHCKKYLWRRLSKRTFILWIWLWSMMKPASLKLFHFCDDFFGAEYEPFVSGHRLVTILINGGKYSLSVLWSWIRVWQSDSIIYNTRMSKKDVRFWLYFILWSLSSSRTFKSVRWPLMPNVWEQQMGNYASSRVNAALILWLTNKKIS